MIKERCGGQGLWRTRATEGAGRKALYEHKSEWMCRVYSISSNAVSPRTIRGCHDPEAQAASASLERPIDVGPTLRACTM